MEHTRTKPKSKKRNSSLKSVTTCDLGVKKRASTTRLPGFEFSLCHRSSVWPQRKYLRFQCLSLLLWTMDIIIDSASWFVVRINFSKQCLYGNKWWLLLDIKYCWWQVTRHWIFSNITSFWKSGGALNNLGRTY